MFKMRFKKIIVVVMSVCLMLALCSCSGGSQNKIHRIKNKNAAIGKTQKVAVEDLNIGDHILLGSYEQDNEEQDDIEWIVINREIGKALVYCNRVIDCKTWDKDFSTEWASSSLREWLNNDFYDHAFSEDEKQMIMDGEDKCFILSIEQVENLLFGIPSNCATDYARKSGIGYYTYGEPHVWSDGVERIDISTYCWIRTEDSGDAKPACCFYDTIMETAIDDFGLLSNYHGVYIDVDSIGVRPAMWIYDEISNIDDFEKPATIKEELVGTWIADSYEGYMENDYRVLEIREDGSFNWKYLLNYNLYEGTGYCYIDEEKSRIKFQFISCTVFNKSVGDDVRTAIGNRADNDYVFLDMEQNRSGELILGDERELAQKKEIPARYVRQ